MDLIIPLRAEGEKTVQVYRALREAIVDGRLPAGHRLPATRVLAVDLGVSRNSVAAAYERLVAEGYLFSRVGSGTYVAPVRTAATPRRAAPDPLRPRPGWDFLPLPVSSDAETPRYDFRTGIPDAHLFPFDTWRRLVAAEVRLRANSPGTYAEPSGHPGLRAAIARYLGVARSIRVADSDVLVTNGTQHALDLIARVVLRPGDVVAVEDPGYPPARRLFTSLGARVVSVPVDDEGLVVGDLPGTARLVYATPSHQFPLGRAMSLARRQALLDWARRRQVAIVEDDYDSEFRFSARPLEPLFTLDTAGRVLYVGTFPRPCSRPYARDSRSCRPRYARRWSPLVSSTTGTGRSRCRPRSPGSSTRGSWRGTCARRPRRTRPATSASPPVSAGSPVWTWCRPRRGCTSPRCCGTTTGRAPGGWSPRAWPPGSRWTTWRRIRPTRDSCPGSCSGSGRSARSGSTRGWPSSRIDYGVPGRTSNRFRRRPGPG